MTYDLTLLLWVIGAAVTNSFIGLIGIFSFFVKKKMLDKLSMGLISFSGGALLGGAFLHLLPESLEKMPSSNIFILSMFGFILFFIIEGYFHWHLCEKCEAHSFTYLMIIGDIIHNFIDGLVIAASFFIDIFFGIITTLVIISHEAPQQLGLFGVLIYGGHTKKKSLIYSFMAQCSSILGSIIGFFASSLIIPISSLFLPIAAGGFIYIAASDLVPEIHRIYKGNKKRTAYVIFLFMMGILVIGGLKYFTHSIE